jgi:hypothetical protein
MGPEFPGGGFAAHRYQSLSTVTLTWAECSTE